MRVCKLCRFTSHIRLRQRGVSDIDVYADDHANLSSARFLKTMYSDQEGTSSVFIKEKCI